MNPPDRLIVAIDRSSREEILQLAAKLRGVCGLVKIGLQAFVSNGPAIVNDLVREGHRIFLDLKFHDIPNTVSHAVAEAANLKISMMTIHAGGGAAMCRAAAEAASHFPIRPSLLGVTVLTSLGSGDLTDLAVGESVEDHAVRLASLCRENGVDGVVASPQEIGLIRSVCGPGFLIVTPGIRGPSDAAADQKRTMRAAQAIRSGADFIVVGRPITAATDPRTAAFGIIDEISNAT